MPLRLMRYLPRGTSTSSFLHRTFGWGSPCTWQRNSTVSSSRTTWLMGRRMKVGRSAARIKDDDGQSELFRNVFFDRTKNTYRTQWLVPSRSLSLQPCWYPHRCTCQHHFSSCWRSLAFLLASGGGGNWLIVLTNRTEFRWGYDFKWMATILTVILSSLSSSCTLSFFQ